MSENRNRTSWLPPILAAVALVLLAFGGYVGAYLWMGERSDWWAQSDPPELATIERTYHHECAVTVFAPAAWVESVVRRVQVDVVYNSPEREAEELLGIPTPPGDWENEA